MMWQRFNKDKMPYYFSGVSYLLLSSGRWKQIDSICFRDFVPDLGGEDEYVEIVYAPEGISDGEFKTARQEFMWAKHVNNGAEKIDRFFEAVRKVIPQRLSGRWQRVLFLASIVRLANEAGYSGPKSWYQPLWVLISEGVSIPWAISMNSTTSGHLPVPQPITISQAARFVHVSHRILTDTAYDPWGSIGPLMWDAFDKKRTHQYYDDGKELPVDLSADQLLNAPHPEVGLKEIYRYMKECMKKNKEA